jgi:hypothetical protein
VNAFNAALLLLIATSTLWIATMSRVEAPKPILKPQIKPALQVDCEERGRICRARTRMEKVKERKPT